jgi:predicted amidohydrolase YtcJ
VGNPFDVEFVTIASILDKLRAKAQQTPPGFWVEGFFYDDTKVKDKRPLNIRDLDQVSKDHPVSVQHRGGHTTFYNSKAFELAGITRDTPDPPGGTFDRDAAGNLNGRVTDNALAAFEKVGQRPQFSAQEQQRRRRNGAAHMSKQFVRYGLTSVHHEGGDLGSIEEIRDSGELLHRVNFQLDDTDLDRMIAQGVRTGFGDEWVRIGATQEHTVDARWPKAEALAIRAGRFIAVGTNAEIAALASKRAQVIDAQGMTIVPGFIDCHVHPVGEVLLYVVAVGNPLDVVFVTVASILV